jgi:outer membrane protein OmpA-like peptidoglycan-associated protein
MRVFLATTCILAGTLLAGGCATKKYVRNTTAPIQAKVDQVGQQTTQNGQQIEDTRNNLKQVDEKAQTGISAAQERASSADQHATAADQHAGQADQHATDAMNRANQVGDESKKGLDSLSSTVAKIDDYKLQTEVSVPFAFAKSTLNSEAKENLDKVAGAVQSDKRFVISVEGFTDKTGSKEYNEALSRKRAEAVVHYLVASHDIPIYRIHTIGLGQEKPVDDGKTRSARAKNRRVEVKVFTVELTPGASTEGAPANAAARR